MASNPAAVMQQHGAAIILAALGKAVGQSAALLNDETTYRRLVADPAWEGLPAPLRLMGKDRLHWDELMRALRREAFDTASGRAALRADASARVAALIGKLLDAGGKPALDPNLSSGRKVFAGETT